RFADAGIAADQYHAAGHQPAAQHAVELLDAGGLARLLARTDRRQVLRFPRRGQRRKAGTETLASRRGGFGSRFHERVPLPATGTLALPLGRAGTAFGAGIKRFLLRHQPTVSTGTRGASAQSNS